MLRYFFLKFLPVLFSCLPLYSMEHNESSIALEVYHALKEFNPNTKITLCDCKRLSQESKVVLINKALTDADFQVFIPLLRNNQQLTSLELFGNQLGGLTARILKNEAQQLITLNVERNNFHGEGVRELAEHPTLKELNLSENKLTFEDSIVLAQNTRLEILELYRNELGDMGIIPFSNHPSLKKLDLRRNEITDQGALALSYNICLEHLVLGRNPITRQGIEYFLNNIQRNPHLKILDFLKTRIAPGYKLSPLHPFLQREGSQLLLTEASRPSSRSSQMQSPDTVLIMSIDGGGIRGLIPALILQTIADKLRRTLQDDKVQVGDHVHLGPLFNLIAGTSTGGLIALGLTTPEEMIGSDSVLPNPRWTIDKIVDLYKQDGGKIFSKQGFLKGYFKSTYSPKGLETQLLNLLGDTYLSACLTPLVIPAFNLRQDSAYIFNSRKAKKNKKKDFLMRDVGRSTSAAPTYFPAAEIENCKGESYVFIDGGVFANNPSYYALREAKKRYPEAQKYLVVSLGTGAGLRTRRYDELRGSGKLGWATKITAHLMGNNEENTKQFLNQIHKDDPWINIYRIQPTLRDNEKEMDNVQESNIIRLTSVAQETIQTHKKEIEEIVGYLKESYKRQYLS